MDQSKTVLITGATSGIGEACANAFAKLSYNLIITGRRQDRLDALSQTLVKQHNIRCIALCFDVQKPDEVNRALENLKQEVDTIDILINNAGLALGNNTIDEGLLSDWETMIDTNIKGLLYVSRQIIPYMKQQGFGHIINIGSIAGKETYKNGNVYCATKHAVDSLTKAMRIDLLPHHIKVTGICPGAAETEFSLVRYKGDDARAKHVYDGFKPLSAEDIAEVIVFVSTRPAHVNINDILITPLAQANTANIWKGIPSGLKP
jgi:3-hydroxy acid dehydrogenase/malonic semialdehyde reductase